MKILTLSLIVSVFFFLGNTNNAQSQHMDDWFYTIPILIKTENGKLGSGFFVRDSLHIYMVTARHCLIDSVTKDSHNFLTSRYIRCISYTNNAMTSKEVNTYIYLSKADSAGLLKHEKDQDIAAIQLGKKCEGTDQTNKFIYYHDFVRADTNLIPEMVRPDVIQKYADVHIGDDVFIMGYPTSLGLKNTTQFDHERPLLRKGIIAGKNIMKKTIILDCPAYYGNSGGPVFIRYFDTIKGYTIQHYRAVGVMSEFIPYADSLFNKKDSIKNIGLQNSGYSVAVPFETIFDLFK